MFIFSTKKHYIMIFLLPLAAISVVVLVLIILYMRMKVRPKSYRPFGILSDTKNQSYYWCDNLAESLYELIKLKDVPQEDQRLFFGTNLDFTSLTKTIQNIGVDEDDLQEKLSWLFVGIHEEDVYSYEPKVRYHLFILLHEIMTLFCKLDENHCEKGLFKDNWDFFFNRAKNKYNSSAVVHKLNYKTTPKYLFDNTCDMFTNEKVITTIDSIREKGDNIYESLWTKILELVITKSYHPTNITLISEYFDLKWNESKIKSITDEDFKKEILNAIPKDKFTKERMHAFESLLYALVTDKGPGLLFNEASEFMQEYHQQVLIDYADSHKDLIERASKINEEHLSTLKSSLVAIKKIKLCVEYEFPTLWYYDTKSVADKDRLRLEYNEMMKDMKEEIKFNFRTIGKIFNYFKRNPSVHKRHSNDSFFMSVANSILGVRNKMVNIGRKPGRFILRSLDGYAEGFQEQFMQDEEKRKKSEPIIEPFGKAIVRALMKPMRPIFMLVEMLIFIMKVVKKIVEILTNPIKLILLPIVLLYIFTTVLVCLIETYGFYIFTAILLLVFTFFYMIFISVISIIFTTIYVVLGHLDVEVFNAFFAVYMYILFVSCENDIRSWYTTPSYEQGNKAYRSLFGTFLPCGRNFTQGFFFCEKNSPYIPLFSPQANIYKIVNGMSVYGASEPKPFVPDVNFHDLPQGRKTNLIKQADRSKRKYFRNVAKYGSDNNEMIRTICTNSNSLGLTSVNESDLNRLCYISFCQNGNFEPFCATMNFERNQSVSNTDKIEKYLHLISYIVMLTSLVGLLYVGYGHTGTRNIVDVFSFPKQLWKSSK